MTLKFDPPRTLSAKSQVNQDLMDVCTIGLCGPGHPRYVSAALRKKARPIFAASLSHRFSPGHLTVSVTVPGMPAANALDPTFDCAPSIVHATPVTAQK